MHFFYFFINKTDIPVLGVEPRISSLEGLRVGPFCYTGGLLFYF
jgi:hypothetical protein